MRAWPVLLLLLLVPAASAHERLPSGSYLGHIDAVHVELAPGAEQNWTLAYEGAPMPEGWNWLVRADVEGDVEGSLHIGGLPDGPGGNWSARWTWGPGQQAEDLVLGRSGFPELRLRNLATGPSNVTFYYDHTCDCSAKAAPLSPGLLWLNVDATAGQTVTAHMFVQPVQTVIDASPMPRHINVTARYLVADDVGGFVPHATSERAFRTDEAFCDTAPSRWNGCMELRFEARHDGRQLIRVTTQDDAPTWKVLIVPDIQVQDADAAKGAPLPWSLLGAALLLAAVVRRGGAR